MRSASPPLYQRLRFSIDRLRSLADTRAPFESPFTALFFARAKSDTALNFAFEWGDKAVSVLLEEEREQLSACTILRGICRKG